jgi:hypothetical protein
MSRKTLKKYLALLDSLGLLTMEDCEFQRRGKPWQGYLFTPAAAARREEKFPGVKCAPSPCGALALAAPILGPGR